MEAHLSVLPNGKRALLMGDLPKEREWRTGTLAQLLGLRKQGTLNPTVVYRIPLTEAYRAHELLERGEYAGKVVLVTE